MQRAEAELRVASFQRADPARALAEGLALIKSGYSEQLLPEARKLARKFPDNVQAQQLCGLAARDCGESAVALSSFKTAARLAPHDALIAHSYARTALEAGQPSSNLFSGAARLAPNNGGIILGLAAAQINEGQPSLAVRTLERALAANPLWVEGHKSLAALTGQLGQDPLTSLASALARHPFSPELHHLAISLALQARDYSAAGKALDKATEALGNPRWLVMLAAHVASESDLLDQADCDFASIGEPRDTGEAWMLGRHLLRRGAFNEAAIMLESWLGKPGDRTIWPYLSLAWRAAGDQRAQWLESDPSLVGIYDLGLSSRDLNRLADYLRERHFGSSPPLDQSVRGGTQTDGNLLLRTDALIADLRARLLKIVEQHVKQLPRSLPDHPSLPARRDPLRIAGSWSVRLTNEGYHTDHVHPHGWFSSALYISIPETDGDLRQEHAGWLSLGEARDLVPGLAPHQLIEPKPGRLVLFPSIMWHGTRAFPQGERLSVAFDIALPKQD